MRGYPEAHLIHELSCSDAPLGVLAFRASVLEAYPNSRPHRCFSRDTVTYNRLVVAEPIAYERHRYRPSTIRPDDATRNLCAVCRGTHPDEPIDLLQWLGLQAAR